MSASTAALPGDARLRQLSQSNTHYSIDLGQSAICTRRRPARWSPIYYTSAWQLVTCKACLAELAKGEC